MYIVQVGQNDISEGTPHRKTIENVSQALSTLITYGARIIILGDTFTKRDDDFHQKYSQLADDLTEKFKTCLVLYWSPELHKTNWGPKIKERDLYGLYETDEDPRKLEGSIDYFYWDSYGNVTTMTHSVIAEKVYNNMLNNRTQIRDCLKK